MRLYLAALLVLVSRIAHAEDPPALDAAVKQAAAAGKPLVVELYATWCKPCQAFESGVMTNDQVRTALGTVMFVRYDIDRSPGTEAASKLGSMAVPTFVALDASGTERARKQGGLSADDFVAFLESARVMTLDQTALETRLAKHPGDARTHMEAARWFLEHGRASEAIGQWQHVAHDKAAPAGLREDAGQRAARQQRIEDWRRDLSIEQVGLIRRDLYHVDLGLLAAAVIGSPLSEQEKRDLLKQVIDAQTNMDALNSIAYVALAAQANDLALAAATKVVADARTPQRLDTLAECNHMLGNTAGALALEDEALTLAKGGALEPQLRANRKRFESGTDPSDDTQKYESRAKELWAQVEHADAVPVYAWTPAMKTQMASIHQQVSASHVFDDSLRAAERNVEAACRAHRGTTDAVVARFDPAADGHATNVVLLTDGTANKALRACVERELKAWVLPTPPKGTGRQSASIVFPPP